MPVDVTTRARHGHVRARQRETREFRVIEFRPHPARRCVARAAVVWKARGHVIGAAGPIEVLRVTAITIHRQALELAADVARRAIELRVHSGQREAGDCRMVERRTEPVIGTVAGFARRGEIERLVVYHPRRIHEIRHMARDAVGS